MKPMRFSSQIRLVFVATMISFSMGLLVALALHFSLKAAAVSATNGQLKTELRDLVERLAEVEGVLQKVAEQRRSVDELTMSTLGALVDVAAIDPQQNVALYQAMHGLQADEASDARLAHVGPPAAMATYGALVARLTTAREAAAKLVGDLRSTASDLRRREAVFAAIPSRLPAQGWLSSEFGVRKSPFDGNEGKHKGLDIAANEGTTVYAPASGVVSYAGNFGTYGKLVKLDHDFGISTRYAHSAQILVKRGQKVQRGEPIAVIGSTGRSTGPHVHYEVLLHGEAVDPQRFVLETPTAATQPLAAATAPKNLGIGGDDGPVSGATAGVASEDGEATPEAGLLPWLRGERLILTSGLPQPLGTLTTADLSAFVVMLVLLTVLTMLVQRPQPTWR